jgi:hypothetical protein
MAPKFLYKAFDSEEVANNFLMSGRFRLSLLDCYRKIEDPARADADEGEARIDIPNQVLTTIILPSDSSKGGRIGYTIGTLHRTEASLNKYYLFCVSGPEVSLDYIATRFGRYIVKISQPQIFLEQIRAYAPKELAMRVELLKVEYTKGILKRSASEARPVGSLLSVYQKPPKFSAECEYRYILEASNNLAGQQYDDYIPFTLKPSEIMAEKAWV